MQKKYLTISISILVILLALRIFLRPLGQDEGVFLTIGQNMAKGLLPYRNFFDHKPPGIYFLFVLLYRFFGSNVVGYKIFLLAAQLASAGLVWRITKELKNRETKEQRYCENDDKLRMTPSSRAALENDEQNPKPEILRQAQDPFGARYKQISNTNSQKICHSRLDLESIQMDPRVKPEDDKRGERKAISPKGAPQSRGYNLAASSLFAPLAFLFLAIIFEGERLIAEPFMGFCLLLALYLMLSISSLRGGRFLDSSGQAPQSLDKLKTSSRLPRLSLSSMARNDISRMIASGLFLGLALLFKQTAVLSVLCVLGYLIWRKEWKNTAWAMLGMIIPLGLTTAYLGSNDLMPNAYHQIITYNFYFYPSENIGKVLLLLVPYFFYTAPIWVLFVFSLLQSRRVSSAPKGTPWVVLPWTYMLIALALVPMLAFFGRHYPHYWLQSVPFVAIIAACGLSPSSSLNQNTLKGGLKKGSTSFSLIRNTVNGGLKTRSSSFSLQKHNESWLLEKRVQALACFLVLISAFLTFQFIRTNHPKFDDEQKLTAYLRGHDKCIYAENQFIPEYFLTGKTPPIKYLYVTEITDTSEQAEQKTIEQLENNSCLVIWPADSSYAYARDLQSYILNNYHPIFLTKDLGAVVYEKR